MLTAGAYRVTARASIGAHESGPSTVVSFNVPFTAEDRPVPIPQNRPGDLTGDGRVDLVDVSIFLYWLDRGEVRPEADWNSDGKLDLADVSIMMYWWTG